MRMRRQRGGCEDAATEEGVRMRRQRRRV